MTWLLFACLIYTLFWAVAAWRCAATLSAMPELGQVTPVDGPLPALTVVVCARNEEFTLEKALQSLLAEDYPELELIVVNDRSTDGTGQLIERMAAEEPRLRPLHLAQLPDGWIGKVHAQWRAASVARGQWLLFTDADIHYRRGCLRRAMSHALAGSADHVVVLPRLIAHGVLCHSFMFSFQLLALTALRILPGGRLDPRQAIGVGAFNLVRREVLARGPGLEWLKMEVIDDMGLGVLVRDAGGTTQLLRGLDWLWVTWYPSLSALARGLEKNLYAALSAWRPLPAALKLAVLAPLAPAPLLVLLIGAPWSWIPVALLLALHVYAAGRIVPRFGQPGWVVLTFPLGAALLFGLALRAVILAHLRRGVIWRGTFYSLTDLRAGQRVFLSLSGFRSSRRSGR